MYNRRAASEIAFDITNGFFLTLLTLITLYPMLHVLFASLSDPAQLIKHTGLLLSPKGFSLDAYTAVLSNRMIILGYLNTLIYVSAATALNIVMTAFAAYGLSRKQVLWKNSIMMMIVITMFFGGGLIPTYLLVQSLGMIDTRWALIIPGAVSAWNIIIMRTAFQGVPESLEESARMDGANDFTILFRVVVPLSLPVIAVMILFYAVGHWNSWFAAMVYLRDRGLYPLQLVLREILIQNNADSMMTRSSDSDKMAVRDTIKYATIMVATLPILLLYPFLQKYFVKGVLIGALKE
ncbi:MAG: sugar transporter permease [Paenibacillus sp.]|nr:sugar transporter permease [Paenibacillus sp.]